MGNSSRSLLSHWMLTEKEKCKIPLNVWMTSPHPREKSVKNSEKWKWIVKGKKIKMFVVFMSFSSVMIWMIDRDETTFLKNISLIF